MEIQEHKEGEEERKVKDGRRGQRSEREKEVNNEKKGERQNDNDTISEV